MMDIKQLEVTVGEVCEGYFNDAEEGLAIIQTFFAFTGHTLSQSVPFHRRKQRALPRKNSI